MPPKIAIVYCAVLEDEIESLIRGSDHVVHIEKLEQGLHNDPPLLNRKVQEQIERIEENVSEAGAIVIGYGLCSRGTEGLHAQRCKLVLTRAHDCITLLLGSKERYAEYVSENPGTYWYSPGWNRHHLAPGQKRYETLRAMYLKKYGEDNADYLMEQEQHWFTTYDRATFVELRVLPSDQDQLFTKECADWLGWKYDYQAGDIQLLSDLISGNWTPDRFLVLEPGEKVRFTADENIIEAIRAD